MLHQIATRGGALRHRRKRRDQRESDECDRDSNQAPAERAAQHHRQCDAGAKHRNARATPTDSREVRIAGEQPARHRVAVDLGLCFRQRRPEKDLQLRQPHLVQANEHAVQDRLLIWHQLARRRALPGKFPVLRLGQLGDGDVAAHRDVDDGRGHVFRIRALVEDQAELGRPHVLRRTELHGHGHVLEQRLGALPRIVGEVVLGQVLPITAVQPPVPSHQAEAQEQRQCERADGERVEVERAVGEETQAVLEHRRRHIDRALDEFDRDGHLLARGQWPRRRERKEVVLRTCRARFARACGSLVASELCPGTRRRCDVRHIAYGFRRSEIRRGGVPPRRTSG